MNNEDKKISGVKTIKSKQFSGHINSLLDEMRLKLIIYVGTNSTFEDLKIDIAKKIKDDSKKIEALALFEDQNDREEIAITIKDDDKKIESLNYLNQDYNKASVIGTMKDDRKKLEAMTSLTYEGYTAQVLSTMKIFNGLDDVEGQKELFRITKEKSEKQEILKEIEKQKNQAEEVKKIENDIEKINALDDIDSEYLKAEVAKTIKDDKKKIEVIEQLNGDWSKAIIAQTLKDDTLKLEVIRSLVNDRYKSAIAESIEDDIKKIEAINLVDNDSYKEDIIITIKNDDKKISTLDLIEDTLKRENIIRTIKDDDKRMDLITKHFSYSSIQKYIEHNETQEVGKNDTFLKLKRELKTVEKYKKIDDDNKKIEIIDDIDCENIKAEIIKNIRNNDNKIDLINTINDENLKIEIIKTISDFNCIANCIENNLLELSENSTVELLTAIAETDYIKKYCIDNSSKLSKANYLRLIIATQDNQLIEDTFSKKDQKQQKIDLPSGMTIGTEIEAEGMNLKHLNFRDWLATSDNSLKNGTEFVSPILTGTEIDSKNIYLICNMLEKTGFTASERCGGHVHIGAAYLTSSQSYTNLIELWGNCEKLLYSISNTPGDITRYRGVTEYAKPISEKVEKALQKGTINLENEKELADFTLPLKQIQGNRYTGINFFNIGEQKNTIEFRLSNGTINPDTWIENINLFGGIVSASEKLAQIQKKSEQDRTDDEQKYLKHFEKIDDAEISEEEKLQILLYLTVSEDKRQIYINRYRVNNELLHNCPKTNDAFIQGFAKDPIKVKEIGKRIFTGPTAISGVDINDAQQRLESDRAEIYNEYTREDE